MVDPELGINVVDLGLVYGVLLDGPDRATIDMTLTSAACPLTDVIEEQAARGAQGHSSTDFTHQLGVDAAVGPGEASPTTAASSSAPSASTSRLYFRLLPGFRFPRVPAEPRVAGALRPPAKPLRC